MSLNVKDVANGLILVCHSHCSAEHQESMIYRPVKIRGEFDHSNELYLGPRPINKQQQGLAANEVGFHVITPFKLTDSG